MCPTTGADIPVVGTQSPQAPSENVLPPFRNVLELNISPAVPPFGFGPAAVPLAEVPQLGLARVRVLAPRKSR